MHFQSHFQCYSLTHYGYEIGQNYYGIYLHFTVNVSDLKYLILSFPFSMVLVSSYILMLTCLTQRRLDLFSRDTKLPYIFIHICSVLGIFLGIKVVKSDKNDNAFISCGSKCMFLIYCLIHFHIFNCVGCHCCQCSCSYLMRLTSLTKITGSVTKYVVL